MVLSRGKLLLCFTVLLSFVACNVLESPNAISELPTTESKVTAVLAPTTTLTPAIFPTDTAVPQSDVDITAAPLYEVPLFSTWQSYENQGLKLAMRYPPDWFLTQRGNGLTLTAPEMVNIGSESIPWLIWVSEHPKFAEDASLFDVIVNEYHFPNVIEQFEESLTEEIINGRTAYRSTIIPAAPGGQLSVFFEVDDRFVEVTLRPFDAERPYENQEALSQLFATFLETVTFLEEQSSEEDSELGSIFTSQDYGFSVSVPPGWTVVSSLRHRVSLVKQGTGISLRFGVKWATDEIDLVRTGVSAGDFFPRESVIFLGEPIASDELIYLGKVKAIFYEKAVEIVRGNLIFVITVESNQLDYEAIEIPDDIKAEADAIVASVVRINE